MNLTDVAETVRTNEEKKSDMIMNLLSVTPRVEEGNVHLRTRRGDMNLGMTRRGLCSYLEKINIPVGFFDKCSDTLKTSMLGEFHVKHKEDVMLRLIDGKIRFMASTKYQKFDDISLIESLENIKFELAIKEFKQSDNFFTLRAVSPDPIVPNSRRPFYPGIQIINSEVGMSSVKVLFLLYEEVCTNGLLVSRAEFPRFSMKHFGNTSINKVGEGINKMIAGLPKFIEKSADVLHKMDNMSVEEFENRLKVQIPESLMKKVKEKLPNYQAQEKEATGLDLMSSFTEAIQTYSAETRIDYERVVGYLLPY